MRKASFNIFIQNETVENWMFNITQFSHRKVPIIEINALQYFSCLFCLLIFTYNHEHDPIFLMIFL